MNYKPIKEIVGYSIAFNYKPQKAIKMYNDLELKYSKNYNLMSFEASEKAKDDVIKMIKEHYLK